MVILFLLGIIFLWLALNLTGSSTGLHILEFAVGSQAGVVFGAAEVLAVLMENEGGNDERSNEGEAEDVLDSRGQHSD